MRIGFIVDGAGEKRALPNLLSRIDSPHELVLVPVIGKIQPKAAPEHIAQTAATSCLVLDRKEVDLAVILLDLEDRTDCPGCLAEAIEALIARRLTRLGVEMAVTVVFKVTSFESWLVADVDCLREMPRLFPDSGRVLNAVPRGNADGVDSLDLLRRASGRRGRYDKVQGAVAICRRLDPGRAAQNSRSFRRFLCVLGDSRYADQSRLPNSDA